MDTELAQLPEDIASMILEDEHPQTPQDFARVKNEASSIEARLRGNNELRKIKHNSSVHKNVLSYFNESIAFAPNVRELALGYHDRSVLLHHLKKYKKAIIDIDRALALAKSDVLKAKLMCRKADCLNYVDREEFKQVAFDARISIEILDSHLNDLKLQLRTVLGATNRAYQKPLPEQPSEEVENPLDLTYSKNNIEIKQDKKFGRHLITNSDVEAGEIMMIQNAYALVPHMDITYLVCSVCFNCAWNGIPCDTCPCVFYCSEDCKQKAWQKYHEVECPMLSILMKNGFCISQQPLVLRVIATALQEEDIDKNISKLIEVHKDELHKGFAPENFTTGKFRTVCHLSTTQDNFPLDFTENYEDHAVGELFSPMLEGATRTTVHEFMTLVRIISSVVEANAFAYFGSDCFCEKPDDSDRYHKCKSLEMGTIFVADSYSLINHGCVFNVGKTMKNGKVILFSTKPVPKGSQLFLTYAPTILEKKEERQEYLQEFHRFTCTCIACEESCECLSDVPEAQKAIDQFYEWKKKQMGSVDPATLKYDDYVRMMPELKKELKKIFDDNTAFKAEVESHHYQSFLYYAMLTIYGAQITIPANCDTQN